jgi:catechol 2,3-dioxygenase-like lactoylglutathione lyase family enzyme
VSIKCDDLEATAKFYKEVFDLKEMGRRGNFERGGAIYLSDGVVNLALVKISDPNFPNYKPDGLNHIGFLVDDLDAAVAHAQKHGATISIDPAEQRAHAAKHGVMDVTEVKLRTPDGVSFDLAAVPWPGAVD